MLNRELRVLFSGLSWVGLLLAWCFCVGSAAEAQLPADVRPLAGWKQADSKAFFLDNRLFVVLGEVQRDAVVQLPRLSGVVQKVSWLQGGSGELSVQPEPGHWVVKLTHIPEVVAGQQPVLVVDLDGPVRLFDPAVPATARADGLVFLRACDARVRGKNLRYEPQPHKNTVGYWSVAEDSAEWLLQAPAGEYSVEILQGCGRGHGGSRVQLSVQEQRLEFVVRETGHFQNFVWRSIGKLSWLGGAEQLLTLRCVEKPGGAVMDVRAIRLVPEGVERSWQPELVDAKAFSDLPEFRLPESDEGLAGSGPIRRYDWFRGLWQTRRAGWEAVRDGDRGAVVFLGDSITQGAGDDFQGLFPGLRMANRGISGDTTRGMLLRLQQDVLSLRPAAVVLLLGTNDLEEGASAEVIAGNLKLIVAAIHRECPETPIVLNLVFPSAAAKKRPAESIRQINQLYGQAVRGDALVTLLDTWSLFANSEGDAKAEDMPDLLHPNEAGYRKWAGALRPVLATLGLLETGVDEFQPEPGYELLFNGRDLTGWGFRRTSDAVRESAKKWMARDPGGVVWPFVDADVAFAGDVQSSDGRYRAINGRLVVATPVEGRRIQQLWTVREFPEDFTLKLEFRATPNADSGVFLREPQLQCRDFVLAGPWKELQRYRAGDWNELVVEVRGGMATATCNGELLGEPVKLPSTGPIGLEGDRGQMEYRRIRIRVVR
jgi:lysophospholipase L1-like esterase